MDEQTEDGVLEVGGVQETPASPDKPTATHTLTFNGPGIEFQDPQTGRTYLPGEPQEVPEEDVLRLRKAADRYTRWVSEPITRDEGAGA